jgi:hypothetical protein
MIILCGYMMVSKNGTSQEINQIEALIAQYIGNEPLSMATEGNCTII